MNWLLNYLGEVQKKSQSEKKRFAFLVSLVITAIIFAFWLSALVVNREEIAKEFGSVRIDNVEEIKADIGEAKENYSTIKNFIGDIRNTINNLQR